MEIAAKCIKKFQYIRKENDYIENTIFIGEEVSFSVSESGFNDTRTYSLLSKYPPTTLSWHEFHNHFTALDGSPIKHEKSNSVTHPKHYNFGKIEVIEYIEDQNLGYHLGNSIKYISRAGKKDPSKTVEDLKKAIWYVERRIELESETPRRPNEMNK